MMEGRCDMAGGPNVCVLTGWYVMSKPGGRDTLAMRLSLDVRRAEKFLVVAILLNRFVDSSSSPEADRPLACFRQSPGPPARRGGAHGGAWQSRPDSG